MAPFTCVDIAKIGLRAHGHTLPYGLNRKTYSVTEQEESDLDDELWIEVPCIAAVTSTGISLSTLRPVLHESGSQGRGNPYRNQPSNNHNGKTGIL
ncbi:hypothetical protein WN943_026526 [Citrus x changshan-huyou]